MKFWVELQRIMIKSKIELSVFQPFLEQTWPVLMCSNSVQFHEKKTHWLKKPCTG